MHPAKVEASSQLTEWSVRDEAMKTLHRASEVLKGSEAARLDPHMLGPILQSCNKPKLEEARLALAIISGSFSLSLRAAKKQCDLPKVCLWTHFLLAQLQ